MLDILASCLLATQSTQVVDLNQSPGANPSSVPRDLVASGTGVFFSALTPGLGRELWFSTGPAGTTSLVVDGVPGSGDGVPVSTSDGMPIAFAGGLVYNAFETDGISLRFSGGTEAGTVVLADFHASTPQEAAGFLYFRGSGGNLWRTDGTPAGTSELVDLGAADQILADMTATADGTLYVRVYGVSTSDQLLQLPPGATAPVLVDDLQGFFPVDSIASLGNLVVMANGDATDGTELWVSDGTAAGTQQLADLNPGSADSDPSRMVSDGTYVWFTATDAAGEEVWRTDGTAGGTVRLTDIWPGSNGSSPMHLTPYQGGLLFTARSPVVGNEPWVTTATAGTVTLVSDLASGLTSSDPLNYTVWNGRAYFSAEPTGFVDEPFVTDGTPGGTSPFAPPSTLLVTSAREFAAYPAGVLFDHFTATGGEPWSTDGTPAGTQLVQDVAPAPLSADAEPRSFVGFEDRLFFGAEDGSAAGSGLYASDGTAPGTQLVFASVDAGTGTPRPLGVAGDRLLFTGADSTNGLELWSTTGTSAGTQLVEDIYPGIFPSFIQPGIAFEGRLYFSASDGVDGLEPWVSDGTPQGTFQIGDIAPGAASSDPGGWILGDDTLYFTAGPGPNIFGEPTDERLVCAVAPGSTSAQVLFDPSAKVVGSFEGTEVAYLDGHVYYETSFEFAGIEFEDFYATNVSDQTTTSVQGGGLFAGSPVGSVVWQDRLYWVARVTTPIVTGATALASVGAPNEVPLRLTGETVSVVEDRLAITSAGILFWGIEIDDSVVPATTTDPRLYVSDGTPGGATPVFGGPGQEPSFVDGSSHFEPYGAANSVVFRGRTLGEGVELWVSDGTAAGTLPLADVYAGTPSSQPADATTPTALRVGNLLYFAADDGATGIELHAVPFAQTTGDWAAEPYGSGCAGGSGLVSVIGSSGAAALGQALTVELEGAPPGTPALLFLGFSQNIAPISGCTSYLAAPLFLSQATTDGSGATSITFGISTNPFLVGLGSWLQWFVVDPGTGFGGLSDALEIVIGS